MYSDINLSGHLTNERTNALPRLIPGVDMAHCSYTCGSKGLFRKGYVRHGYIVATLIQP